MRAGQIEQAVAAGLRAGELPRTTQPPDLTESGRKPGAGSGPLISEVAALAEEALAELAGLSGYSSSSGCRIVAPETRSLILVSYRKFQNDFRETGRGNTSHIVDVRTLARTSFSDKRPIIGTSGSKRLR